MGKDEIALGCLAGLFLSFLPLWRSGEKRGLTFWDFAKEHTVFAGNRQWVRLRDKNTDDDIWVELTNEPRNKLGYTDWGEKHKGGLIAHLDI